MKWTQQDVEFYIVYAALNFPLVLVTFGFWLALCIPFGAWFRHKQTTVRRQKLAAAADFEKRAYGHVSSFWRTDWRLA